jgi:L-serine dehydratase, iron-sulfur-dependent, beta subunit
MAFISVFDVLGPNMIGPSSSHTAGACVIAFLARKMLGNSPKKVEFILYGSFANTYKGHGTDRALLGGLMGFGTDDVRIRDSFNIADERGIEYKFTPDSELTDIHPNTVDVCMEDESGNRVVVRGESLGGGKVRIVKIDRVDIDFSGEYSAIILVHRDRPGVIAYITKILSEHNINIAFMKLYRESKGNKAYTIIESDEIITPDIKSGLYKNEHISQVMIVQ